MWAAQFFKFEKPHHWMTSAARHDGLRVARSSRRPGGASRRARHDIAGEASILMNIQEMSTICQYRCR